MKVVTPGLGKTDTGPGVGVSVWRVLPDADAVARAAAKLIIETAADAITHRGRFRLVLAGGRTPEAAYHLLAHQSADWEQWEIFFGDERCLPVDHVERNSGMAERVLLSKVPITPDRVHAIAAERGAEASAASYARILAMAVPFDLVLLGVGEDGHTASLFPGRPLDSDAWTVPVYDAPKPPPERVSLGLKALRSARQLLVLVTGATKRKALLGWRAGEELPIAQVCQNQRVTLLLDEDANPDALLA